MKRLLCAAFLLLNLCAAGQSVDFAIDSTRGAFCNPSTVRFQAMATGEPQGYFWTFGNGMVSDSRTPAIRYANAGTYRVELVVIYQKFTRTVRKNVVIHPRTTVSVVADRDFICTPGDISFTATANQQVAYNWSFGDGSTASGAERTVTHAYNQYSHYDVEVAAVSDAGCTDTARIKVRLDQPKLTGVATNTSGCVPVTSRLTATAAIPKNSTVTSYIWNYQDGTPLQTTPSRVVNHAFADAGVFQPVVSVTTSEGCTQTFQFDSLAFGTPPQNLVAGAVKDTFCGSDSASFFVEATNANLYVWNFGDGNTAQSTTGNIKHKYTRVGRKTVTVTPYYNDCPADPAVFEVEVIGMVGAFRYQNTCSDRKTFEFTNTTSGRVTNFFWTIAGESDSLFSNSFTHTFPDADQRLVALLLEDSITGCKDRAATIIYTAEPKLQISDTSVCRNSEIRLSLDSNYTSRRARYTWHAAGKPRGVTTTGALATVADSLGVFGNYVVVDLGAQYCKDTVRLRDPLRVRGPLLDFAAPAEICFKQPYSISNFSRPFFAGEDIEDWHWNYGERVVNDTTYQPTPYYFARPGTFRVKLQASDNRGCADSLVKTVRVNALPFIYLVPKADTLCLGETDSLFAFYNGTLSWNSSINLPCTDCDTLLITPTQSAAIIGTATSSLGCSVSDTISMIVHQPFTASSSVQDAYICPGDTTVIHISPPGKTVTWDPSPLVFWADSSRGVVAPAQTTDYNITLGDPNGCFQSTTTARVNVKAAATVDAGPDQILGYGDVFQISPQYSGNIVSYNWRPSQALSCTTCPTPAGKLLESQVYSIDVVSDSGCIASDTVAIMIECRETNLMIPNAFSPNGDRLNDEFYPIGRGIRIIRSFSVFDRYGKPVFERKNFLPNERGLGWDGKRGGMNADVDVYVFYLEAECDQGQIMKRKGTVTLVR